MISGGGLPQRFLDKIDQQGTCWIWGGTKVKGGYGVYYYNGKNRLAHHVAWIEHHGAIPVGFDFCHHCDNPSCVNPEHIWLGTTQDNMLDMQAKGRNKQPKGEKHNKAKLKDHQVLEILASDKSGPVLADLYGVTRSTINSIKSRKMWRHITKDI